MTQTVGHIAKDIAVDKDKGRNPSTYVSARALSAASEQITVPAAATRVLLEVTADTYVAFGANPTAAVPTDLDDGTANERIGNSEGKWFYVNGVAKIAVYSASGIVTASFYND